jgi:cystathionine beta-lyase/cystathionine gamma-synthase
MPGPFSAESRLIHAGTARTPGEPATPPLIPASIYVSQGSPLPGRGYGRDGNPGWEALEQAIGGLEDAEAVAFASGQAASMALMLALAPGRDRIVLPQDGYYGGRVLADRLRPRGRCCGPRRRLTRCSGWPTWPGSAPWRPRRARP